MDDSPKQVPQDNPICLDQFLKLSNVAATGGMAKQIIQDGEVLVNDKVETRRRRKLSPTDIIEVFDQTLVVQDFLSPPEQNS